MNRKIILKQPYSIIYLFLLVLPYSALLSQQKISEIKLLPPGSVVTTTGIIISGDEYDKLRYMQDADAGIPLFSSAITSLRAGDSILVTGVLSTYEGQLQISPVISHQVITTVALPAEKEISLMYSPLPGYSSMRVRLPCMGISTCKPAFDAGPIVMHDQNGISLRLRMHDGHSLIGEPIPDHPISAAGILTHRFDQYYLLCDTLWDAVEGSCRVFDKGEIRYEDQGSVTLAWEIEGPGNFTIEYGKDTFQNYGWVLPHDGEVQFTFEDTLTQGMVYTARLKQFGSPDTIFSLPVFFASGENEEPFIEILFNQNVSSSFSDGSYPKATGPFVIEADLIERIDDVEFTLDAAIYNNTSSNIVAAINRAAQRGVAVRYITDNETSNTALEGNLSFPVLFREGSGLMHHKFLTGDAGIPGKAWVWTGSTNLSAYQLSTDPNNAIIIHEQALAQNYKREMDELWGQSPTHESARSGDLKADNSCHAFQFGTTFIESYFSPSDETNCHIINALRSADHHIEIALLILTRQDIVDELISLHQNGVLVRVIVDDEAGSSEAIFNLRAAGIKVLIHDPSNIFHHKYSIIDEGFAESDPQVITGSHNWTFSADHINDENTLIVHNQSVANIYRQEFEARWTELNGTITSEAIPYEAYLYPNPANEFIIVNNPASADCLLTLFDMNGRIVEKLSIAGGESTKIDLGPDMRGICFMHWVWPDRAVVERFICIR